MSTLSSSLPMLQWASTTRSAPVSCFPLTSGDLAKRAYLSLLLSPPPALPPPASIRPYDRPDAAQIIASLAARTMGHRSSMSSALTSSSLANIIQPEPSHSRAMSMSTTSGSVSGGGVGGLNGFTMPLNAKRGAGGGVPARGGVHHRAGSASSSWSRQSMGAGVLNFSMPTSSSIPRLPTHSEGSSVDPSRSSSTSEREEPTIVMDSSMPRTGTKLGAIDAGGRRESVTADKALREVEKALASVETQG